MNDNLQSIRGYRTLGEPAKPDRQLSMGYIHQNNTEVALHTPLTLRASDPETPANCLGREDEFGVGSEEGGDTLPTDREAQLLCAGCPVFDMCQAYAEKKHPAWGVHAGKVYGRNLAKAMKEDE